jgi:hypothetical protein
VNLLLTAVVTWWISLGVRGAPAPRGLVPVAMTAALVALAPALLLLANGGHAAARADRVGTGARRDGDLAHADSRRVLERWPAPSAAPGEPPSRA